MPCAESWVRRRNCSPPGTNTSAWRGRSAPPDSTRISTREAVLLGHVHGAQELADRGRARRPAAHGRVVGDDQALGVRHLGQRHDDAAADAGRRCAGRPAGRARAPGCRGRPAPRGARAPSSCRGPGGAPRTAGRRRRAPRRAAPRTSSASARMAAALSCELVARRGEARPEGRAHVVVSQEGRRFSRNASIPSAASAPAKSSADVRRRLGQSLGPPTAGQRPQQRLGGADRPGRRLAERLGLGRHPGIERGLVVDDRESSPASAASRRVEALAGQRRRGPGTAGPPRAAPAPRSWPAPPRPGPR